MSCTAVFSRRRFTRELFRSMKQSRTTTSLPRSPLMLPQTFSPRHFSSFATQNDASSTLLHHHTVDDSLLPSSPVERERLLRFAQQRPTALRLADMYRYGRISDPAQRVRNAQFLHNELLIRIAQRAMDLLTLPYGLSDVESIRQVASMYLTYWHQLHSFPVPQNIQDDLSFTELCQTFVLDRTTIPAQIARGVATWCQEHEPQQEKLQEMEEALYRFFCARVGLRFLAEHHVLTSGRPQVTAALHAVTSMFPPEEEDFNNAGCIHPNVNVVKEVRKVAALVTRQTKAFYNGMSPEIQIVDCIVKDRQFTHVPHHLQYMLAELLKNSCRASIHQYKKQYQDNSAAAYGNETEHEIPPIRVIVVKGEEDVTIKIADKGGGIPRSAMCNIWKFAHSTAPQEECATEFGVDCTTGAHIRGFGLPLARIYARYFGGDLTLKSTEGYGVDAYLHLPRLGESCENLPVRVRDSPGERDSTPGFNFVSPGSSLRYAGASSGTLRTFTTESTTLKIKQNQEACWKREARREALWKRKQSTTTAATKCLPPPTSTAAALSQQPQQVMAS